MGHEPLWLRSNYGIQFSLTVRGRLAIGASREARLRSVKSQTLARLRRLTLLRCGDPSPKVRKSAPAAVLRDRVWRIGGMHVGAERPEALAAPDCFSGKDVLRKTIVRRDRSLAQALGRLGEQVVRIIAYRAGYHLVPRGRVPPELANEAGEIISRTKPFTLTSPARVAALCDAITYIVRNSLAGAIVECGVWRGGSMMAAALRLLQLGVDDRDLYLYDTFQGMTAPTMIDREIFSGRPAATRMEKEKPSPNDLRAVSVDSVRANIVGTGYPEAKVHCIVGPVEETLPMHSPPEGIALLRLDTDFYESTKHELIHLYHRVVAGGVLLLDDYGHFEGARLATDEFLAGLPRTPLLARIDYSGRLAVIWP